ncbi:MAG: hypothetical protein ACRDTC_05150 [Pseudonocardiaceae bacterium]
MFVPQTHRPGVGAEVDFGEVAVNLRAAVAQVLGFARQRIETARWTAFRSHFSAEAFIASRDCRPSSPLPTPPTMSAGTVTCATCPPSAPS